MSTAISALIVDDEPLARERLRTLLGNHRDIRILGECGNGREAIRAIAEHSPDLLFLDVQMPEVDGFAVLEAIRGRPMPAVIFVTAYDQYALRAFDVHALDYLLKPFDRERFERALERARSQLDRRHSRAFESRLLMLLEERRSPPEYLDRLVIKSGGRIFFLKVDEVECIEAQGNYVRLHAGAESHLLRETMTELEAKLDPKMFLRIHRSHMVNVERIRELVPWFHGGFLVRLRSGQELPSGRGFREKIQQFITAHGS